MMTTTTPLWKAQHGCSGLAIVGMDWDCSIHNDIELITKNVN
jgi:hypothetical protein